MTVLVTNEAFDPGSELNAFQAHHQHAGAVVTFTGLVRSDADRPIVSLRLECYPELANAQLADLIRQASLKFGIFDARVIHRYGDMSPGEAIVQVMTLAAHRSAAFKGAEFLMDYLKTDAPFWKKEIAPHTSFWVEPKAADDQARARWD